MASAAYSILVVEDDRNVLSFMCDALAQEGYEVSGARNGLDALAAVAQSRPALILLDLQMPIMDGWEFIKAYRQTPGPHAPIIITAAGGGIAHRAAAAGADGFLMKPFELDEFLAIVAAFLAERSAATAA